MAEARKRRKSDGARQANQVIRSRTAWLMLIFGVGTFLLLFWKLFDLQILRHEELESKAVSQQTRSSVITASRGTIYDRSGEVLAISTTAETVNISPKDIASYVKDQETAIEEARAKAAEKGESYTAPEVKDEDYNEFYKTNFHDFEAPQRTISVHAEGALTYDALLFIPSRAPFDMYSRDYEKGLALYSSNVLIMDKCADLLPDYYNFVRGIVDSADLTLNISRETLQRNSQLQAIANKVEKKITAELEKMRDQDREAYEKFFGNFGRSLKFGVYSSYGTKTDELAPLFLFYSAKNEKLVTLDEYVEAMDAEQKDKKEIYYAAGESRETLLSLPTVKAALKKGYDVLLCTEDVDEFTFQSMRAYKECFMKSVTSADFDLATDDEKKEAEDATKANEELFAAMKEILGDKVSDVVVSPTLEDAPSAIAAKGMLSLEMERVLAQGPDADKAKAERVLQINAKHPVFDKLKAANAAGDKDKLGLYTELLYDQALLVERMPIEDPVAFAQAICKLM